MWFSLLYHDIGTGKDAAKLAPTESGRWKGMKVGPRLETWHFCESLFRSTWNSKLKGCQTHSKVMVAYCIPLKLAGENHSELSSVHQTCGVHGSCNRGRTSSGDRRNKYLPRNRRKEDKSEKRWPRERKGRCYPCGPRNGQNGLSATDLGGYLRPHGDATNKNHWSHGTRLHNRL